MKKNLWVLLAISALIAMFVIAGCAPKPTPTPTPTPTATPVVPPSDYCPTSWETTIAKIYSAASAGSCEVTSGSGNFQVYITFDKQVTLLDKSTNGWSVKVARYVPYQYWVSTYVAGLYNPTTPLTATVNSVSQSADGKTIILTASLSEKPFGNTSLTGYFCGLICNLADYTAYITAANIGATTTPPPYAATSGTKYADLITWKYTGTAIYDEALNICSDLCGISDTECCDLPVCETCVTNCPVGSACD